MTLDPKKNVKAAKDIAKHGPKRHHWYYVLIVVCGWFLPPLAVLVRFGVGLDFFLNIILTLCGYIPGHFHNFYLQNIRNNKGKHRTPRWAVRAGLVQVDEGKKAKRQWANRYDERNAVNTYEDSESSGSPHSSQWDGRGPEPPPKDDIYSSNKKHNGWVPWGTQVDADEVEGAQYSSYSRSDSSRRPTAASNEFREEFYQTDGLQDSNLSSGPGRTPNGQPSKLRSLVTGTKAGGSAPKSDRFDRMERARRVSSNAGSDWERRNDIGYYDHQSEDTDHSARRSTQRTQRSNVDDLDHTF